MDHQTASSRSAKLFAERFGFPPAFVSVAPGRVNLIGEHVDHQGYDVLPAALNQTIQVAIGINPQASQCLNIQHADTGRFASLVHESLESVRVVAPPVWSNYVLAAFMGVLEVVHSKGDIAKVGTLVPPLASLPSGLCATATSLGLGSPNKSLCVLVDGTVPEAAGVSSSSALVVASTIAFARQLNVPLSRVALADVCANSERNVGIAGGGMDQAAICLSKANMARLIHFHPLSTEAIPLPNGGALVVCNSGRDAPKAVSAATCYNKRVFELKLGCYMILKNVFPEEDISVEAVPSLTLRGVQEKCQLSLMALSHLASRVIPWQAMGKPEVLKLMGKDRVSHLVNSRVGPAVWERNVYFEPLKRVLHVCGEADRVAAFAAVCRDEKLAEEEKLIRMGRLMDASGESLDLLFDCGCPELSELTDLARELGAYGSRLTGAGWGGCTVSLVKAGEAAEFAQKMADRYYSRKDRFLPIAIPNDLSTGVFVVRAGDGASIFEGTTGKHIAWD